MNWAGSRTILRNTCVRTCYTSPDPRRGQCPLQGQRLPVRSSEPGHRAESRDARDAQPQRPHWASTKRRSITAHACPAQLSRERSHITSSPLTTQSSLSHSLSRARVTSRSFLSCCSRRRPGRCRRRGSCSSASRNRGASRRCRPRLSCAARASARARQTCCRSVAGSRS